MHRHRLPQHQRQRQPHPPEKIPETPSQGGIDAGFACNDIPRRLGGRHLPHTPHPTPTPTRGIGKPAPNNTTRTGPEINPATNHSCSKMSHKPDGAIASVSTRGTGTGRSSCMTPVTLPPQKKTNSSSQTAAIFAQPLQPRKPLRDPCPPIRVGLCVSPLAVCVGLCDRLVLSMLSS